MPINSRAKGARVEREAAEDFRAHGYPQARRAQQYAGVSGSADLAGTTPFSVEVKGTERLDLHAAVEQAEAAASRFEIPIVYWKKNNRPALVVMSAEAFWKLEGMANDKDTPGAPA